jgi:hypothetical protein
MNRECIATHKRQKHYITWSGFEVVSPAKPFKFRWPFIQAPGWIAADTAHWRMLKAGGIQKLALARRAAHAPHDGTEQRSVHRAWNRHLQERLSMQNRYQRSLSHYREISRSPESWHCDSWTNQKLLSESNFIARKTNSPFGVYIDIPFSHWHDNFTGIWEIDL